MGGFIRPKHFSMLTCNFLLAHKKVVSLVFLVQMLA